MKTKLFTLLIFSFCALSSTGQKLSIPSFNLDFEKNSSQKDLPDSWIKWGMNDYTVKKDSSMAFKGRFSTIIYRNPNANLNSFGSMAHRLPANYKGKSIRLEAQMKIEDVANGYAAILMRVDGAVNSTLDFKSLESENIHGSHDWKKYTITLPLREGAESIHVAGILKGEGKAWFDDFEVFIDNKNIKELEPVEIKKAKAQLDIEFDKGSDIKVNAVTEKQVQNLFTLGKVWGFVKYNHPEIAKGNVNWDYELFRVLPKVMSTSSAEQAETIMLNWLQNIFPSNLKESYVNKDISNLKLKARTEWFKNNTLIKGALGETLSVMESTPKPKNNYYIGLMPSVRNPSFNNELAYNKLDFTDDGIKILALFRYWNMIEYYFPYRHLIDENWDNVLKTFIPKMINADDNKSYKLTLLELIGKVQDTHANIWQNDEAINTFWGNNIAPIEVKMIEDKVVITRLMGYVNLMPNVKVGDIITSVNGQTVKQLIDEKIMYCPASNRPTQLRDLMRKFLRTNDQNLELFIEGKGAQKISCVDFKSINFWETDMTSNQLLDGNIGYIYPAKLKKDEIHDIMKAFKNTKGLVIDLRCYPSDFIVFKLGGYLMPQPTDFVKFTVGSLNQPGNFTFSPPLKVGENNKDYYKGKIVILINETTQSQAEYTAMALRVAPKATVIGSTTAGADGNVSNIILPGNIKTMISGIGIYSPKDEETQRVGIIPDINMQPTVQGIKNGVDELLNKAIETINKD